MAVKITKVDPAEIDTGQISDVDIIGEGLDRAGLEAFVMDYAGENIDTSIGVGQPIPDDISANRFPVTIDVPEKAKEGDRNIGIKLKGEELKDGECDKKSTTCYILKDGIKLK